MGRGATPSAGPVVAERLAAVGGRLPGSDAERRAARLLAGELRARGRKVRSETVWIRPRWALTHALLVALALAGSVLSVAHPQLGLGLAAGGAAGLALDAAARLWPLRRLTRERATQNVVSDGGGDARVRLVLTCGYDAPRGGLLARLPIPGGAVRWLVGAQLLVMVAAAARTSGAEGVALGAAQLAPTIVLILGFGALLDAAFAEPGGSRGEEAAAAVVLMLADALARTPPRNLGVDVVFAGAASAQAAGMRAHLRAREAQGATASDVVVLHVGGCPAGPRWWLSEGPLVPLAYHPRLVALCGEAAEAQQVAARPTRSATWSGALAARRRRWPALRLGGAAGAQDLRATAGLAMALIGRLDAEVGRSSPGAARPKRRLRR